MKTDMSQETFEEQIMKSFDEVFVDGINGVLVFNSTENGRVSNGVKLFLKKALKDQRESIISEIEDMQTRVTVNEIINIIRN